MKLKGETWIQHESPSLAAVQLLPGDICRPIEQRPKQVFATWSAFATWTRHEVVSIATLPGSHRNLALLAFDAGCHVLCEKPVAMNLGEAAEMVRTAERAQRLLSVCFQYGHCPILRVWVRSPQLWMRWRSPLSW